MEVIHVATTCPRHTTPKPIAHYRDMVEGLAKHSHVPVRFAITGPKDTSLVNCEVSLLTKSEYNTRDIFHFRRRGPENIDKFTCVFLVPTGIGAEIGGHAGDATPAARLAASICDTLITHPNVVNASDINELPDNGLYVEGSMITDLLMGMINLQRVRANRVLMVIDRHEDKRIISLVINSVAAARAILGLDCPEVVCLNPPVEMKAEYSSSGRAVGTIKGLERLIKVLWEYRHEYDAVALSSLIKVPRKYHAQYFASDGKMTNPWGGIEAMLTHAVTNLMGVPCAHAPMLDDMELLEQDPGIVDPRMAAEAVSVCFLHCVLKGLHKSPRILPYTPVSATKSISAEDISCLVIPDKCIGLPVLAAMEQEIPVIAVRSNRNIMLNDLRRWPFQPGKIFFVDNYVEAVGIMAAIKSGVETDTLMRPIPRTRLTGAFE